MEKEKLEKEHAELKARLAELVDLINSEEFYKLDDRERVLLGSQRAGMEMYINALSIRLWGVTDFPNNSMMMSSLLASMMMPTSGFHKSDLKVEE